SRTGRQNLSRPARKTQYCRLGGTCTVDSLLSNNSAVDDSGGVGSSWKSSATFMPPHTSHYSLIRMHVSRHYPRVTLKFISTLNLLKPQTLVSFNPTSRCASTRCRVSRSS